MWSKKRTLLCAFQGHQPITEADLHLDHVPEYVFSHIYVQLKLPEVAQLARPKSATVDAHLMSQPVNRATPDDSTFAYETEEGLICPHL